MKYPRVWWFSGNVWIQTSPDATVLHVLAAPGATVRTSTYTPDQLSAQTVEVEQTKEPKQ